MRWSDYIGKHPGGIAIVTGLGSSWRLALHPGLCDVIKIGVNDVGCLLTPKYTVVVDKPDRFSYARRRHIVQARSDALFTAHPFGSWVDVPISLNNERGADLSTPDSLPISYSSVFVACSVAFWMGFKKILVCGSDFEGHHLINTWPMMKDHFRDLAAMMLARGTLLASMVSSSPMNDAIPFVDPLKNNPA